jgi:uncharacterized protein HemX
MTSWNPSSRPDGATDADRTAPPVGTPQPVYEERVVTKPAKTSAAAAFSLVFGTAALLSVLTLVLGPLGLVLGLIGLVLGVVGMRQGSKPGITGRGVGIAGLVLSLVAILLAAASALGVSYVLNDEQMVNRLEQRLEQLRDQLPSDIEIQP